jgi:catechol 2,3-dioxygenase-like lactoylglutathione lyase family enzyme
MSGLTQLVAGIPVSELDASIDWYTRFFGRPPDLRVGNDVLWDIDEHATLFIEPNVSTPARVESPSPSPARRPSRAHRSEGIEHEPIETYANGVRHVKVPDPDGNAIAFAERPTQAESRRPEWTIHRSTERSSSSSPRSMSCGNGYRPATQPRPIASAFETSRSPWISAGISYASGGL